IKSVGMKPLIDFARTERSVCLIVQVAHRPGGTEFVVSSSLALEAGTMTGGQPGGFVEEEEFRVAVREHDRSVPSLELQQTHNPPLEPPAPLDLPLSIVKDAPVAHHRSPLRAGDDLAEGCHSVLPGHR